MISQIQLISSKYKRTLFYIFLPKVKLFQFSVCFHSQKRVLMEKSAIVALRVECWLHMITNVLITAKQCSASLALILLRALGDLFSSYHLKDNDENFEKGNLKDELRASASKIVSLATLPIRWMIKRLAIVHITKEVEKH